MLIKSSRCAQPRRAPSQAPTPSAATQCYAAPKSDRDTMRPAPASMLRPARPPRPAQKKSEPGRDAVSAQPRSRQFHKPKLRSIPSPCSPRSLHKYPSNNPRARADHAHAQRFAQEHRVDVSPLHPDGAQNPDLLPPLIHRNRERVEDDVYAHQQRNKAGDQSFPAASRSPRFPAPVPSSPAAPLQCPPASARCNRCCKFVHRNRRAQFIRSMRSKLCPRSKTTCAE